MIICSYFNQIGTGRYNQDLGEDENRVSNDDDTQRSNASDDNNFHENDNMNHYRGNLYFTQRI